MDMFGVRFVLKLAEHSCTTVGPTRSVRVPGTRIRNRIDPHKKSFPRFQARPRPRPLKCSLFSPCRVAVLSS